MKNQPIYRYYLIYSLFLIFMLGVVSLVLIYPAFHKIITIKHQISQEKSDLEKKLNSGLNAKRIKNELDNIEGSVKNLDQVFIKPGEELSLLTIYEALASQHHVAISISPDFTGQRIGDQLIKIPLTINARGTFSDLMSFTNDLDGTPYYYIVDNIDLTGATTAATSTMQLSLTGQVYLMDEETKIKQ